MLVETKKRNGVKGLCSDAADMAMADTAMAVVTVAAHSY